MPRKTPAAELAEKMVRVLEEQRRLGGAAYPLTLRQLAQLADPTASAPLVQKATAQKKLFRSRAVAARPKDGESPVVLAEDLQQLAGSSSLLEFALRSARTGSNHALSAAQLKARLTSRLQRPFQDAVNRQMTAGNLPATVGWLLINRSKKLFLLSDIHTGQRIGEEKQPAEKPKPATEPLVSAAPAPSDFARQFDQAFRQLEQRCRMPNFVSLVDLRRELPCDRATFDAELRKLRLAGRYTLSAAEGREGISPDQRDAGIVEDGALLLYVSRKSS